MEFAENLKALRSQAGLSQEQLAERLGISRQAVAKWEGDKAQPELDKLVELAMLYQITVDELLRGVRPCTPVRLREEPNSGEPGALVAFLLRAAAQTYAGHGRETDTPGRPGAHELSYAEGEYRYLDGYLGGERFIGEETLYVRGGCVWGMNYCGRVTGEGFSGDFLKAALLLRPSDAPYRGPCLYRDGHFTYVNEPKGDFGWFAGREAIYRDRRRVYERAYRGGRVKG